jgi:hypothetical protein
MRVLQNTCELIFHNVQLCSASSSSYLVGNAWTSSRYIISKSINIIWLLMS